MLKRITGILGTCAVLLTVACGGKDVEQAREYERLTTEVSVVVEEVRASMGPELYSNLHHLIAYDVFAVDAMVVLADDPSARLRSNAMFVLSHINDPEFPDAQAKVAQALHDGLADPHRLVRYEAAAGLLYRNDWTVIPVLIEGLNDPQPAVRFNCHQVLNQVTSENFGYVSSSPETGRTAAVQRWSEWYEDWKSTRRG